MSIDEEAALWVARLQSSDATNADRAAFAKWQDSDPRHAAAYAELRALWGNLAEIRIKSPRKRRVQATGAVLVVALALLFGPELALRLRADATAPVGQVVHMTLPDGSRLDLDSGAAVVLDFDGHKRQVQVLRGTVFAEVVPDTQRPFLIQADALTAKAVGTRYGTSETGVIVTEGTVEVSTTAETLTLHAGEAADLEDNHLSARTADADAVAWRDGQLVFSSRPLSQVLEVLARYRHGRILLLNDRAAGRPVSGVFDLTDTDAALTALADSLGLSVTRLPGLTLLR
ncbi:FecR family protein [Paracoccus aminophilus]|nr:FecR domain-containing protein [Paracoccus aminophilus]